MPTSKPSPFFIWGLILLGFAIRVPFTTLTPVLNQIAQALHVSVDSLGILTTFPLLMFALFSSLAPKLAQYSGIERLFTMALLAMVIGSFIRIFNVPTLYLGTIIIGAAIAMLNVLLPALILVNQPHQIGRYTTLYTTSMTVAMAIFSALAVPIVMASSWKTLILVLTALLVVTLVVWLPNNKNNHKLQLSQEISNASREKLWKNKLAWFLLVFGGLQSFLFYTGVTWLPTMAQDAGISAGLTGILAGVYTLIGMPFSLFLPIALTRLELKQRRYLMGGISGLGIVSLILLLIPLNNFIYWLVINALLGLTVGALFPYLMTSLSLKTTSAHQAAQLSGMVQTGGYFLAAVGPIGFGYAHVLFQSWFPAKVILLILAAVMTFCLLYVERFEKI